MLPNDYAQRVYAGVLGKIIGVYLGRPFESATHDQIMRDLGEIEYYVHERRNMNLIVADDDITGMFTFLRALKDHGGNPHTLTAAQIGQSWLNYIVENRTILWWGGLGNSTEHTAFLNLKKGILAPDSGSIARNSKVVAEQIGSQIFIDGWAMVAPGDPALAAALARKASQVSHDGEAIYGAQMIAAMEAQAFVESDLNALIDCGLQHIPKDSIIARLVHDVRDWHAEYPDWHDTFRQIQRVYGYDTYGGNCHMVPNHAIIHMGLLYGGDDFQKAMLITNTAGWDTDCNAANVGCLLGIKNGLALFDQGPDWRGPVADRLFLPTGDGGRSISDALTESYHVINMGRAAQGLPPEAPKEGAKFHFSLPGAVQGFVPDDTERSRGVAAISQVQGYNGGNSPALAITYTNLARGRSAVATTATFIPPDSLNTNSSYDILASPTLHSGQTVRAVVAADAANTLPVDVQLITRIYGVNDAIETIRGPIQTIAGTQQTTLSWRMPDTGGAPILHVGLEVTSQPRANGTIYLDWLTWSGTPTATLGRPTFANTLWRRAWVDATDLFDHRWPDPIRIAHNRGTGLLLQGTADWRDYTVQADIIPHLLANGGLVARAQGLTRYYALQFVHGGSVELIAQHDAERVVLARVTYDWQQERQYTLRMQVIGSDIVATIDGGPTLTATDTRYAHGAVGLVLTEGRLICNAVAVHPS